jgi:uncharacterized membrane protein YfcA
MPLILLHATPHTVEVLISLPAVIVAVIAGGVVNRRVHPQRFQFLIYLVLAVVGMVLMVQSVRWTR